MVKEIQIQVLSATMRAKGMSTNMTSSSVFEVSSIVADDVAVDVAVDVAFERSRRKSTKTMEEVQSNLLKDWCRK